MKHRKPEEPAQQIAAVDAGNAAALAFLLYVGYTACDPVT
jgi:hypothetical protein